MQANHTPATTQLLLPLKPPLPRRLSPRRVPLSLRIRANGVVIGLCLPAPFAVAYAIFQILGGAQ